MANNFVVFIVLYLTSLMYFFTIGSTANQHLGHVIAVSAVMSLCAMAIGLIIAVFIHWIFKVTTEMMIWATTLFGALIVFGSHEWIWRTVVNFLS